MGRKAHTSIPIGRPALGPGRPPAPAKGHRFGGRQKGTPNKTTVEIRTAARAIVEDPKYVTQLKRRMRTGSAPHMETLMFYYAYGKPRERMELSAPGGKPLGYDLSKLSLPQLRVLAEVLKPAVVEGDPDAGTFREDDPDA